VRGVRDDFAALVDRFLRELFAFFLRFRVPLFFLRRLRRLSRLIFDASLCDPPLVGDWSVVDSVGKKNEYPGKRQRS